MQVDVVELLRGMLEIESLSGREERLAAFLVERMSALGLHAHTDEVGNAVGVRETPNGAGEIEREIVLMGHMDTVPGRIPVRIEDGELWGRGAVDAKGPLAAMIAAVALQAPPEGVRFTVIGAVEEESATSRGARHVAAMRRADMCIIGEPSGSGAVTIGYKGRLLLRCGMEQASAHTAGPGPSAPERMADWWIGVRTLCAALSAGRERLFDRYLPCLRELQSGSDGITEWAMAVVSVRLPPGAEVDELAGRVRELAGDGRLAVDAHEPAWETGRDDPLAKLFMRSIRAHGARPALKLKTGTCDMNIVGPAWRCPIVAYGPGDSGLDHAPNERICIEELQRGVEVLRGVLAQV
ncbi:MAG: [LysW]-lysine hydrolase [Phycisphaeraceae bacterium]|nr:MAG: [LysW]-lysine hydrolase [Phycisphaeraceae bacterium]